MSVGFATKEGEEDNHRRPLPGSANHTEFSLIPSHSASFSSPAMCDGGEGRGFPGLGQGALPRGLGALRGP